MGTGDGRTEILGSPGPNAIAPNDVKAYQLAGTLVPLATVSPTGWLSARSHAATGDLDLAGGADLLVTPGFLFSNPGHMQAYTFTGTAFQPLPALDQDVYPGLGYGATCAVGNMGI